MQAVRFLARAGAIGLAAGITATGVAAKQVSTQEECAAAVREAQTAMGKADEVTEEKVASLLEDARELCEQGEYEKAETKLMNVHQMLESETAG